MGGGLKKTYSAYFVWQNFKFLFIGLNVLYQHWKSFDEEGDEPGLSIAVTSLRVIIFTLELRDYTALRRQGSRAGEMLKSWYDIKY